MGKYFMVGVPTAKVYDISTSALLFESKVLMDGSIDIKSTTEEVRGGQRNPIQFVYNHSGSMGLKFTDIKFDLNLLAVNAGTSVATGKNVWVEETVTLSGGTGTVVGTPVETPDNDTGDKFGYVKLANGDTVQVTFSTKDFTPAGAAATETVCITYYALDNSARYVSVASNFLPKLVRVVLDTELGSNDPSTGSNNIIGKVQMEIPRLQISGNQSITMKGTGAAETPLEGTALAYAEAGGCTANNGVYGTVTEIIDSANWYDHVSSLVVVDDAFTLTHPTTSTLVVWAVPNNGDAAFICPNADLVFTSGTPGKATVGEHTGLITTVATGDTVINIKIDAKQTVETNVTVTVA